MNSVDLAKLFFKELKQYNVTNFRTLQTANVYDSDPATQKAFSSVVTRYFIFSEKHPEISVLDQRLLYYKLKIDMIARYFATYPDCDPSELKAFQLELKNYLVSTKAGDEDENTTSV